MPSPAAPGLLSHGARLSPLVGKAVVAAFRFTPLPAPSRTVTSELSDGRRMTGRMDDHTQRKVLFGVYEPQESEILASHLNAGDTFVDVGANIGWFTTMAARIVGPTGNVFAFEPFPSNAAILRRNIARNTEGNVTVSEAVVTDAPGPIRIGRQGTSDSGSVTAGPWGTEESVEVDAVGLDDVLSAEREIGLMKVDVEGFEAHVLGGARQSLLRTRALVIELNRDALEVAGSSPEEILEIVTRAGLSDQRLIDHPELSAARLPAFCNLLAVRPR